MLNMNKIEILIIKCNMKKIRFGVINFKKWSVNLIIATILLVVGGFATISGLSSVVTASTTVSGVYYNGDKSSKNISLMINVYWGTEFIQPMLDVMKEKGVKTTFFIGGTWAIQESEMLEKIFKDGHEIGNHGYHHKDHDKISEEENYNQIKNTHNIVKELIGADMNLFAPPSGAYNKTTVASATSLGYKTIMWTRDTIDWRDHDANLIYSRAIKNANGGDLILMHPTQSTLEALPRIIDKLQSLEFNLTTVSENIGMIES